MIINFTQKFKVKEVIDDNLEQVILGIETYKSKDERIMIFGRFLNVGTHPIRKEVFDQYLYFLKGNIIYINSI